MSVDDGKTWEPATLKPALEPEHLEALGAPHAARPPDTYKIKARAVDGAGDVQTSLRAGHLPDGATGYHTILLRVA